MTVYNSLLAGSVQTEQDDVRQVKNNAGGYVYEVSDLTRLERFLIIGSEGGTYYVGEKSLTLAQVAHLRKMIAENERLVVDTIVDVSSNGRAYKNSPALFALAVALVEAKDKAYVRSAVNKVVRTGTHLFEFASYLDGLGGWGRSKRTAVAEWYLGQGEGLAYQAVKYRSRHNWTHRDLFRKVHVTGVDSKIGNFILKGETPKNAGIITGFGEAQAAVDVKSVLAVLKAYPSLPWEAIPTQFLKDAAVWKTLFYNNQLNGQALLRNVTRLAKLGLFSDMVFARDFANKLTDEAMIERTKLHPIQYLNAVNVYVNGQNNRNGYGRIKDWTTESVIVDALNEGFNKAFKSVVPAGKRTMLAVDVSGSMSQDAMGLDLSCAQVAGAIAMTVARTEPYHIIRGFTSGANGGYSYSRKAVLTDLEITAKTELTDAMAKVQKRNFGNTDCSQPMIWALENRVEIDTFVVITDNETYAGDIKPMKALQNYRKAMGIDAKLAVLAVAGTEFTIADPNDSGTMDFVGFDSNAIKVLADFSAGRI